MGELSRLQAQVTIMIQLPTASAVRSRTEGIGNTDGAFTVLSFDLRVSTALACLCPDLRYRRSGHFVL